MGGIDEERARLREAQREAHRLTAEARSEADQGRDRMREAIKAFSEFRRREIEGDVRRIMAAALGIDLSQPGWRGWLSFNVRRRIEQEIVARRELGAEEYQPIDLGRATQQQMPTSAVLDALGKSKTGGSVLTEPKPAGEAGRDLRGGAGRASSTEERQQGLF